MANKLAVSGFLKETIIEVLNIEAIEETNFSLGGGTNLAIRYNHRISKDRNWYQSKFSWRMKVRELFRELGLNFPENRGTKY